MPVLTWAQHLAVFVMLLRVQLERKIECRKALLEATEEDESKSILREAASNDGMVTVQRDEES